MTNTIARFEDRLHGLCLDAFRLIVATAAACDKTWKLRLDTWNRHGLLAFVMPNPVKAPPIEIDNERLEDPVYRRRLARKLARPRPGKTVCARVTVDRERLLADDAYLNDICKLLAYRFAGNLLPVEENKDRLVLLKMDADFICTILEKLGPHEIDARRVAAVWMRRTAEELVDRHPLMIENCRKIAEVAANERAKMAAFCKELAERTMADFNEATRKIMEAVNRDADEFLNELGRRNRAA